MASSVASAPNGVLRKGPQRRDGYSANDGADKLPQFCTKKGYTAVPQPVMDHWMARLSGTSFKLLLLVLRHTIGDQEKRSVEDLTLAIPLDWLMDGMGADRGAVVKSIRDLEAKKLISVTRAHRQTTICKLDVAALVDHADDFLESGKPTQNLTFELGKPTQKGDFESGKPTQNLAFKSEKPTPYKEIKKAAAATPIRPDQQPPLNPEELAEINRIAAAANVRIDGREALCIKAGVDRANLTLAHLRWFLRDEQFRGARDRKAVLLSIARDFRIRSDGITWPESLDAPPLEEPRGLTGEELLRL